MQNFLNAVVHSMMIESEGVIRVQLRPADELVWPDITCGSHIDVVLPNGLTRSYSLIDRHGTNRHYTVAVALDAVSRGGSAYIHQTLRIGDRLRISAPRNNFPLNEAADFSVLIAGGIGVTPIYAMARRLLVESRPFKLFYAARSRRNAALLDELTQIREQMPETVTLWFDDENPNRVPDLASIVAQSPATAHFYCCGPKPMLSAYEKACEGRDSSTVHREYFSAASSPSASTEGADAAFNVVLARSGKTLRVQKKISLLKTLLDAGVNVPFSCEEGICGACSTKVLCGVPDHRDVVLSDADRASNQTMIVCCSRSMSDELVLDL